MTYDAEKRHRRSIRLKGYDYSQAGAYFLTICTYDRACLLGEIIECEMRPNEFGSVVHDYWYELSSHFPHVELDAFVLMPNHVHGIIVIIDTVNTVGAQHAAAPLRRGITPNNVVPGSLGAIVRSFKSAVTKRINEMRQTFSVPVWQRNYYEHIIRNEHDRNCIREYILYNPLRWQFDRDNPDGIPDQTEKEFWKNFE